MGELFLTAVLILGSMLILAKVVAGFANVAENNPKAVITFILGAVFVAMLFTGSAASIWIGLVLIGWAGYLIIAGVEQELRKTNPEIKDLGNEREDSFEYKPLSERIESGESFTRSRAFKIENEWDDNDETDVIKELKQGREARKAFMDMVKYETK